MIRRIKFCMVLLSILNVLTAIITLMYVGFVFDEERVIDPDDWKRHCIFYSTWSRLILVIFLIVSTKGYVLTIPLINILLIYSIITNIIAIQCSDSENCSGWKVKWMLTTAWITILFVIFTGFGKHPLINIYEKLDREEQRKFS